MTGRLILTPVWPLLTVSLLILGGLSWRLAVNQAGFIVLGLILFTVISRYPFSQHRFLARYYPAVIGLLLLLPFGFGAVTRGAIRWIPLGPFSLQPSELVKPLLIIVFSRFLTGPGIRLTAKNFAVYLLLLLLPFGLIFQQPDLGTSLVVAAIWLGLLFSRKIKFGRAAVFALAIVLAGAGGISRLQPYQRQRLTSFINPYADPGGSGYQVIQSLIAAGSGGLAGRGLGRGSQSQLRFLPEKQTDFIFAATAEELGFFGAAVVVTAYWWLGHRLLLVAGGTGDEFGRLLVIGVLVMIWFQGGVAMAMNLGLLPITGITLPFVSSGGSSMLSSFACLGLAASVWKFSRQGV